MTPSERNIQVRSILERYFERAAQTSVYPEDVDTKELLDSVFGTIVWGYREILLVIVIAKLLDNRYSASRAFYSCNPRPLFEGPIREVLLERGIPHRKSGPLNVAKAAIGINEQWAAQRRPVDVAKNVVALVNKIEKFSPDDLERFAINLHVRFLSEAQRVAELTVDTSPEADPAYIYCIAIRLIREVPDSGNTPQRIIGLLLETYHEDIQSGLKVTGHHDRASTTNTTSKKPGDIIEEQLDGTIIQVFEVTVKPFRSQRIVESYQAVRVFDESAETKTTEIIVLCRDLDIPEDVVGTTDNDYYFGKVEYKDITYHFIDIYLWIVSQVLRMTPDARLAYIAALSSYIGDPNTSEALKVLWREVHQSTAKPIGDS